MMGLRDIDAVRQWTLEAHRDADKRIRRSTELIAEIRSLIARTKERLERSRR
jgi:hypothetical protein